MPPTSRPALSFEFFPPRTAEAELVLQSTWDKLRRLRPAYVSVTHGAGGSQLNATRRTVKALCNGCGVPVAPHLSCNVESRGQAAELLAGYRALGIDRLVVIRGDRPSGQAGHGPFRHASDMVAFIQREHPGAFHVEVACYPEFHPESKDPDHELRWFRHKVEAGAAGAITQYFYNADSYFHFLDDCARAGIDVPITPGVMPITNYTQLARFSAMCGAEIPQWLKRRLEACGEDGAKIRAIGLDVVTRLCRRLLEGGAPGLHIYTLNRANATQRLCQRLADELGLGETGAAPLERAADG